MKTEKSHEFSNMETINGLTGVLWGGEAIYQTGVSLELSRIYENYDNKYRKLRTL